MNSDQLKSIHLLESMDQEALTRLASALEPQESSDAKTIFEEGDPGDGMYFIVSGTVHIEKRTGGKTKGRKTLAILEPGEYFGEMALFDQQPRSATAVARGATRTLRLSTQSFNDLLGGKDRAGLGVLFAMIRTAGERIRRLNAQVVVYDEIGRAIGESDSLDALLDIMAQQLSQATLADWCLILLRQEFSSRIEVRKSIGLSLTASQTAGIADGKGLISRALEEGAKGRLIADPATDKWCPKEDRIGFETEGMLVMPVAVAGKPLGLVVLGGNSARPFDLNDLNLVRGVARQAAQAILNARHREEDQARSRHGRQFVRF